ncbi:MAG: type II toxin-antitoxin system VapC family toxin [Thermomicrobiales bacterium]|nr:type II toxin-antitoxin system VapC family toxin [Thermomicrobiales bacterium]
MRFLVDSDGVINYLLDDPDTVRILDNLVAHGMGLSVITAVEVLEGIKFGRDAEGMRRRYEDLIQGVRIIPFDIDTADTAATLRGHLRRQRRPVNERAMDILIAATAIQHDLILFTRNTRHFEDIDGLRLWRTSDLSD